MIEIDRLDAMLRKANIPFERADDGFCAEGMCIHRIKYPSRKRCVYSIVQGYGTYGNEDNLLEVMHYDSEPYGWVNAEEIFQCIEVDWSERSRP